VASGFEHARRILGSVTQTATTPATAALDRVLEQLSIGDGWQRRVRRLPRLDGNGLRAYSLVESRRRRIVLWETAIGRPLPGYLERRSWCAAFAGRSEGFVFTDAARSAYVLAWHTPDGCRGYEEFRLPEGVESLLACGAGPLRVRESYRAVHHLPPVLDLARSLEDRLGGRTFASRGDLDALQEWIETQESLGQLRHAWRALAQTVVLDPACGDGEWLLRAAGTLERLYLAMLRRTRSWVDDAGSVGGRRPEHLGDLRKRIAEVERERSAPPEAQVRRLIVARHLFGAERCPKMLRRCRGRILAYAARPTVGPTVHVDCNLRLFRGGSEAQATWAEAQARRDRRGDPPESSREEVEMIASAWRAIRIMRDAGSAPNEEVSRAVAELERRRRKLARPLATAGTPFDPCLEFPAARALPFSVVREMTTC
jgi:hypothetical protein